MDAQMDLDWCPCGKRTQPNRQHCSRKCRDRDELRELDFHDDSDSSSDQASLPRLASTSAHRINNIPIAIPLLSSRRRLSSLSPNSKRSLPDADRSQWQGYANKESIQAWANAIPAGCGSDALSSYGTEPQRSVRHPEFPLSRQRAAPPALNMAPTQPAQTSNPSSPINYTLSALADRSRTRGSPYSVSTCSLGTETPEFPTRSTAYVHASPARDSKGPKSVIDNLARRFRAWGTGPSSVITNRDPVQICVRKQTTTVEMSSSPLLLPTMTPLPSSAAAARFHLSSSDDEEEEEEEEEDEYDYDQDDMQSPAVFSLNLPLGRPNFLDSELQASLTPTEKEKIGLWIAGHHEKEAGYESYGPAFYEKPTESKRTDKSVESFKAPLQRPQCPFQQPMHHLEAFRARGRKPQKICHL